MSEGEAGSSKPFDPLESFRGMRDVYLDAMAKAMVEAVNTEGYAQASGAMLDSTLTLSAPFREAMEKSMVQALQQLSLPSRQDIVALSERFTNVEMRLDDMDAKLDRIAKSTHVHAPAAQAVRAEPAKTNFKKKTVRRLNAKAPATAKRATAKQTQPRKRTARKGTR